VEQEMPIKPQDLPLRKAAADNYTIDNIIAKIEAKLLKAHEDDSWPTTFQFRQGTPQSLIQKVQEAFEQSDWVVNSECTTPPHAVSGMMLTQAEQTWVLHISPKPPIAEGDMNSHQLLEHLSKQYLGIRIRRNSEVHTGPVYVDLGPRPTIKALGSPTHTVIIDHTVSSWGGQDDDGGHNAAVKIEIHRSGKDQDRIAHDAVADFRQALEYTVEPYGFGRHISNVIALWSEMNRMWNEVCQSAKFLVDIPGSSKMIPASDIENHVFDQTLMIHQAMYGLWWRAAEDLRGLFGRDDVGTLDALAGLLQVSSRSEIDHAVERMIQSRDYAFPYEWLAVQEPNWPEEMRAKAKGAPKKGHIWRDGEGLEFLGSAESYDLVGHHLDDPAVV
jgi:hypothetical protein